MIGQSCLWNQNNGAICEQPLDHRSKVWCVSHYGPAMKVWDVPEDPKSKNKKPKQKIDTASVPNQYL